jgi:hypothetical protein
MVDETLSKEEVSALKAFFAVVRLSATFYVVCTTENMALGDLLAVWDADPVLQAFVMMLMGFEKMLRRDALLAAAHLKNKRGDGVGSGGASSSVSTIAGGVAQAAISAQEAGGDVGEASAQASAKISASLEDTEGTDAHMRDVLYYGPHVLDRLQGDSQAKSWLAAKRAETGGAICVAARAGSKQWKKFMDSVVNHDMTLGRVGAVSRVQKWTKSVPAWEAGGKEYVLSYMLKHNFTLPERVDRDLRDEAMAESQKGWSESVAGLKDLDTMCEMMDGMQDEIVHLRDLVSVGTDPDKVYSGKGPMCYGCMQRGHLKPACPLSLEEQKASKSRYYKVKGVKDATLKEAAAAAAAENSE